MRRYGLLFAALALGCSGSTVVDPDQSAGNGSGGSSSSNGNASSASSSASSVGTGPAGCTKHLDCPDGLCVFATGTCAPPCKGVICEDCGPGLVCHPCATSSGPDTTDCRAACLPPSNGRCDDTDGC